LEICYNIQTHAHPEQIARLVHTLVRADPACTVYLSHDRAGCFLPPAVVEHPAVHVSLDVGGRGRFHNIARWLGAARWLQRNRPVDFVVTLTGQDYPIRPIPDLHAALRESGDGLMEHFPVLRPGGNWPIREGRARYLYSWHDLAPLTPTAKNRLRPLLLLNFVQPLLRFNVAYDNLRVGVRARSPFRNGFSCWGGSFFTNLSWRSVEHVLARSEERPIIEWARRSLLIEEAFFQSILLSAGRFTFANRSGRYYDFSSARHGSPATLTAKELPVAVGSKEFFARKWDPHCGPEVFDRLDELIGIPA
jgi:hypothetical protein